MASTGERARWLMRGAAMAAVIIIVGVGVAAFVLSYETLRDLAELAGIAREHSWLFPVIVDGTILQATVSVMVLSGHTRERRWFSWVLGVGAVVSVAGNSLHAFTDGAPLPNWVAAVIAAIAPVALLVDTHGVVMLFRAAQHSPEIEEAAEPDSAPVDEPPTVETEPTPVPEPVSVPEPVTTPVPAVAAAVVAPVQPIRPRPIPVPVRPRPVAQPMLPLAIGGAGDVCPFCSGRCRPCSGVGRRPCRRCGGRPERVGVRDVLR